MTAHTTGPGTANRDTGKLRNQLFISSALLTSALLILAAWVINRQVVGQARQQVQAEVETLLPLYDAVWNEQARRLAAIGATMADSPIVKTVFGDARAARDQQTLHEMLADAGSEAVTPEDLVLMTDGGGQIFFAEQRGKIAPEMTRLEAARVAGERQSPLQSFTLLGGRLFQLALTPVVLHSGSAEFDNTLAVLGIGVELNREVAAALKRRIHSEVVFLLDGKIYASSLAAEKEPDAIKAIRANDVTDAQPDRSVEINVGGDVFLAFSRQLTDFDGKQLGQVVVLRSLAGAGQLFRAISNQLLLLWSLAIAAAWLLSYLIAGRITKPLESLVTSANELGQGNYEVTVPAGAQGEVAQLAGAFDQMRHSLKQTQAALLKNERLATIGQMASSIIHDLRNPLATISTAAEIMKKDGLPADRRQTMLETQLRASERMNTMLTELLDFSRGSYKLNLKPQSLQSIAQRVTGEFAPQLVKLKISLSLNIPDEITLDADEEKLGRVFENLLANSMQAMLDGGTIEIRAVEDEAAVKVEVIDDGPGIPAAIRERLFEPFISQGKDGGTGLGLAIARGIISAHGGEIGLADSTTGAHFVIQLPQTAAAGGKDGAKSFAG
ncbi:MAG: ATP-binding protein [Blastocatellales bacterium]